MVDDVESDLGGALALAAELEDRVPLPRVRRGDVELCEVLQLDQVAEDLDGAVAQFGFLRDVLELFDAVDHEHEFLSLLLLLAGVEVAFEFVALDELDAEQDQLVGLLAHPLAEGVGEVVALVAALDAVFDVGLLLAELGEEGSQLGLHVFADGILEFAQPDLDVLVPLDFDGVFLEWDFLAFVSALGYDSGDFGLGDPFRRVFEDA